MTTDNRITLPTNILPNNYRLSLSPDMEKFTFGGEVQITVEVSNTTNEIVLNAAELEIQKVVVKSSEDQVGIRDFTLNEEE